MATDKGQDPIGPNPHERGPQGTGDKDMDPSGVEGIVRDELRLGLQGLIGHVEVSSPGGPTREFIILDLPRRDVSEGDTRPFTGPARQSGVRRYGIPLQLVQTRYTPPSKDLLGSPEDSPDTQDSLRRGAPTGADGDEISRPKRRVNPTIREILSLSDYSQGTLHKGPVGPTLKREEILKGSSPELSWKVDPATGRLAPPQITFTAEQLTGSEFNSQVAGADAVINPPTPKDPEIL